MNFLRRIFGRKPTLLMSTEVTAGGRARGHDDVMPRAEALSDTGGGDAIVSLTSSRFEQLLPELAFQDMLALLLCYAAKTKWLLLSEPVQVQEIFQNVFRLSLEDWPKQRYVQMMCCLQPEASVFRVELFHSGSQGYLVTNDIPPSTSPNDLATQYFFLLRFCVEKRGFTEEEIRSLGGYLELFTTDVLFTEAGRDASRRGLGRLFHSVNDLLGERRKSFPAG